MKNIFLMFILCFLVFGMMFNAPMLLAGEDQGNEGKEKVGKIIRLTGSIVDDTSTDNSDEDDEGEDRRDRRERIRDGEFERKFERRFIDDEGREIKIKRRIRIKDGEFEIETELKVEGEGSNLSVLDSEGRRHRVRVTPERLRALMLERLNADNVTNFSLEEVRHKNIPRVVFKVNSEHPGRFLGIFKLAMKAEMLVDPETGEVLDFKGPWWAFLVIGTQLPDEDEIVGNETIADEVVADDEELEEEFGDIEIEDDVETEVEISGDVELSGEAQATINELVSSFEGQEGKVELKLKVKKQDNETTVESEVEEGILTTEQENLWNTLIEQVQALVEGAEGDDVELEIEIEHELEVEDEEIEEEEEVENELPSLTVSDQSLGGNQITIDAFFLDKPGYVVIHKSVDEKPGPVIGNSELVSGSHSNFKVTIDETQAGAMIFVMLHYDDGDGLYEFPGDDTPVKLEDEVVVKKMILVR